MTTPCFGTQLLSTPNLCKLKITSAVAATTAAGYALANRSLNLAILMPVVGAFLLACGSSALNQIQEWRTDVVMLRTWMRPIPSRKISLRFAWAVAVTLLAAGGIFLAFAGWLPLLLGALPVFWYNCIYTPLKRRTAFAVIPGALIGAVPPAIGWTAAGGGEGLAPLVALCGFLFLWQIPHFWLLALLHEDDYQRASYPTIGQSILPSRIVPVTVFWIALAGIAGMILPAWGMKIWQGLMAWLLVALPSIFAAIALLYFFGQDEAEKKYLRTFYAINGLALAVIGLMVIWAVFF